jgi:pyruvate,orthophosphate dikinase
VVLVSDTSDPDDYPIFADLAGVVTRLGGVTSHAAVAALEAEIVALVGASPIRLDLEKGIAAFGDVQISEGEWISIEGAETGVVYLGKLDVMPGDLPPGLTPEILAWAAQTAGDG